MPHYAIIRAGQVPVLLARAPGRESRASGQPLQRGARHDSLRAVQGVRQASRHHGCLQDVRVWPHHGENVERTWNCDESITEYEVRCSANSWPYRYTTDS